MTRRVDSNKFFNDYVGEGVVMAALIIIIGLLFGVLIYDGIVTGRQKEHDLYAVLQGESISDPNVKEVASLIKLVLQKQKSPLEHLTNLNKLLFIGKGKTEDSFYLNLFLKKRENISGLVDGKIKNLSGTIKIPKWMIFWKWLAILSWLCLAISATINFIHESSFNHTESLLEWPWDEVWVYPAILVMSPALLPCMTIEIIERVFRSLHNRQSSNVVTQSDVSKNTDTAVKKQEALQQILSIQSKIETTKKAWIENNLGRLDQETSRLEEKVSSKKSALSQLGEQVVSAQQTFAESQKELTNWQASLETTKSKAKEDYLRDFEQLTKLQHVSAAEVSGNELHVYTDIVYINYLLRKHEIGIIIIYIDMMSGSFLRIENLCSTHKNGDFHPYGPSGSFCWGDLSGSISKALRAKEFASAVQFMIQAIYSADGDNPSKVEEWKEV